MLTYTADARFRVKHAPEASEWTLEIKFLQKRDEGTYYCQVHIERNRNKVTLTLIEKRKLIDTRLKSHEGSCLLN